MEQRNSLPLTKSEADELFYYLEAYADTLEWEYCEDEAAKHIRKFARTLKDRIADEALR